MHKRRSAQEEECTRGGVHKGRSAQEEECTRGGVHKRRSAQEEECTRGGVHKRRSAQEEECTEGRSAQEEECTEGRKNTRRTKKAVIMTFTKCLFNFLHFYFDFSPCFVLFLAVVWICFNEDYK